MPEISLNLAEALGNIAFITALIELIIALYIGQLNLRHRGYRYASISLLILAVNTFALWQLHLAEDAAGAYLPTILLAATFPAIIPAVALAVLALIYNPLLQTGRGKGVHVAVGALTLLPLTLTLIDVGLGARLWFTPLVDTAYRGGYVDKQIFTNGALSGALNVLFYGVLGLLLAGLLVYTLVSRKTQKTSMRVFAGWVLVGQVLGIIATAIPISSSGNLLLLVAASSAHLVGFALVAFTQGESDYVARGSLQTRLTLLMVTIALPLLGAMGYALTNRGRAALEENASATLASINQNMIDATEIWLVYNTRALRTMVSNQAIISMGPSQQLPVLRNLTATYPDIFLASTVDRAGRNVARSDSREAVDYSNRTWFKEVINGLPVSQEVSIDPNTGLQMLVVASPIRDVNGQVLGVGMLATELTQVRRLIAQNVRVSGATIIIVDDANTLVATSEQRATTIGGDYSGYYPIAALRRGVIGAYDYTDDSGVRWIANVNILSGGWGIIVQQTEEALFAPVRSFQQLSLAIMTLGALALLLLTYSTMRQAMRPVKGLTETAAAITAGDLSREAPVYGEDELGILAESFNTMTGQLRELINSLENRVQERTQDLERRAVQLQVTADVARDAAAIHDPNQLLNNVVQMISERFDFYHAGIFLLEGGSRREAAARGQPGEGRATMAVLRAASSEGGQRMLRRGHRLSVGKEGIVGYVAATGEPRVALDVGRDAVFFNNPDLPMTRSEMGLPLKSGGQVIGVLDVQSTRESAFSSEDVATLQTLADQLAVAIVNANLIDESQQALRELEMLYGMQIQQGWESRLGNQPRVFHLAGGNVRLEEVETPQAEPPNGRPAAEAPAETPVEDAPEGENWAADEGAADGAAAEAAAAVEITGLTVGSDDETPAGEPEAAATIETDGADEPAPASDARTVLEVPIELRGVQLGRLHLRRASEQGGWTDLDHDLARETLAHMAQALENARLVEEIRRRARQEEQINQIVARTQGTLGLDGVMRTAVQELVRVVNASKVQIRLGPPAESAAEGNHGNGAAGNGNGTEGGES